MPWAAPSMLFERRCQEAARCGTENRRRDRALRRSSSWAADREDLASSWDQPKLVLPRVLEAGEGRGGEGADGGGGGRRGARGARDDAPDAPRPPLLS